MDSIQKIAKRMLGKKIQSRRIEFGYQTQEELAEELEVDRARVSRWENGTNFPNKKYWPELVRILELTEKYFYDEPEKTLTEQDFLKLLNEKNEKIKELTQKLLALTESNPKKKTMKIKPPKTA